MIETYNIIRLRWQVLVFHAGGSNRHAGDSDSEDIGLFLEQFFYFSGRYMTLNNVAIHDGCVAGLKLNRDLVVGFYFIQGIQVLNFYLESSPIQIFSPIATTTSSG